MKKKPLKLYRQGDILIEEVAELPKNLEMPGKLKDKCFLAIGEQTNHHHECKDTANVSYWSDSHDGSVIGTAEREVGLKTDIDLATWMQVDELIREVAEGEEVDTEMPKDFKGVEIVHPEHDTIYVPPGNYKISRQIEYHPEELRNVMD